VKGLADEELARLESDTFKYFADEVNLENGLVPDSTRPGAHASIAAVGFALTAYPIAVERKYLSRAEAVRRTLTTQPNVHCEWKRMGLEGLLRPGPGPDRHDDREPPHRFNLETDAPLPLHR
jgi:hypothetical protein